MSYNNWIRLIMAVIYANIVNNKISLKNTKNFNETTISLENEGFFLIENAKFNGDLTYRSNTIMISPEYVLSMFFDYDHEDYTNKHGNTIRLLAKELSDQEVEDTFSYIELIKLLDDVRKNYESKGHKEDQKLIPIELLKLRRFLNAIKAENYPSLKNEIKNLSKLSASSISILRNTNQSLARKIERLAQIEYLLEKYSKILVLEKQCDFDRYDDFGELDEDLLNSINLSKNIVDWDEFSREIAHMNSAEITTKNENYSPRSSYNSELTYMGLDKLHLPGTPNNTFYNR